MEVSTFYSTLEIIEFGLLGLFFGWWIKYLFGAEDSLSLFLKSLGFIPSKFMFSHSVLMGIIIYFREEFYHLVTDTIRLLSSDWFEIILGCIFILCFIFIYLVFLLTSHKNADEFFFQPGLPSTKTCPYCRKTVALIATKCPYCTSDI